MKKRFSFESKITGILLVILGLVTITGLHAYRRFTDILAELSASVKPDTRLITAEALLNTINDAELSAKSYSLTRDTLYLEQFYLAAKQSEQQLADLQELSFTTGTMLQEQDSLEILINKKISLLNDLLFMQDQYRVQKALNRVVDKIEESAVAGNETESGNKRQIFDWLFKKEEPVAGEAATPLTASALDDEIKQIRKEEQKIEESLKSQELELMIADQEVSRQITGLLTKLKTAERLALTKKTAFAELAMTHTNNQIAWFCFATGTLLLFMAALIINYVRNNNRYKIALRNSRREAEETAQAKQRFLANMSHEIRTPMNAIAGFTEQIAKGPLNADQRTQLGMVQKSAEHLLYIINEVLDFSKLQANKVKLETIGFRPKEVLNEVVSFIRTTAEAKKLSLKWGISDDIPPVLLGDPFRLRQILLNLGSNAVKFTEKGEVELKITVVKKAENTISLRCCVNDTGIGMDESQLNKVFKEFEQADASTSRNFGGSGLGLSIVNMLVRLHGGKINISSKPKAGTLVCVELQYKTGTAKDLITKPVLPKSSGSLLSQLNVLIVDDEDYNRKLLATILKNHNANFREARTGREALTEIKANPFDVVLMDARMPELSGIEATVELRKLSDRKKRNTPVIALTAAVTRDDKEKYKKAGMNGFLAKPFKEQELINEIERVMKNEKNTTNETANKKPVTGKNSDTINLGELQTASNGDVDFYMDMLELFIEGTQKGIEEIENGYALGDWERVANYAHKISSPCRHISARNLYHQLKEIETITRGTKSTENIGELVQKASEATRNVIAQVERELAHEKERKEKKAN